ncbi:hypothetical protein ABZ687_14395 [Streptomyces ardesiacus]|uniref:hypothetical protein n=1 Tax=Streptomyces TaxID=1883 RepID=UPI00068FCCBD|nr:MULTISPECIES: hypothetical protein [unclassified Streptomyces]
MATPVRAAAPALAVSRGGEFRRLTDVPEHLARDSAAARLVPGSARDRPDPSGCFVGEVTGPPAVRRG